MHQNYIYYQRFSTMLKFHFKVKEAVLKRNNNFQSMI